MDECAVARGPLMSGKLERAKDHGEFGAHIVSVADRADRLADRVEQALVVVCRGAHPEPGLATKDRAPSERYSSPLFNSLCQPLTGIEIALSRIESMLERLEL